MAQKKPRAQVKTSMLEVAQEVLAGDKTNLETMQQVVAETVAQLPTEQLLPTEQVEQVKVRVSIGSTAIKLILENPEWANQKVLEEVKKLFPSAQTTMACIAWYKSKLRKEGKIDQRVFKKPQAQPAAE